jgi:hypothetical protein
VTLEAEVLAADFHQSGKAGPLLQVYGHDTASAVAAAAFRSAMRERGMAVQDIVVGEGAGGAIPWKALLENQHEARLVLWAKLEDVEEIVPWADSIGTIVLSSTLSDGAAPIPEALRGKVMKIHPFVLPERRAQHLSRMNAWLRVKKIPVGEQRIQANSFFAATTAADGLMNIARTFSREYFIESIEDMMDNALTTSVYPRVSLGPGQRYVSKGAYLLGPSSADSPAALARWVVP